MKRLIFLEWGRGIAALLVVLHHATLDAPAFYQYKPFANVFYFGMAGVDFFFVLSGFIIYYIHSEDQGTIQNIKKYILKRFIRVYPIFFIISILLLFSYMFFSQSSQRVNLFDIKYLITSFLLLPSPLPPLLTVSWTLVHEMFFYLLFIIIILNKKIGVSIFILWGIMILFVNLNYNSLSFPNSFYFNLHNIEFLLGISIAFIIKKLLIPFSKRFLYYLLFFGLLIFILNGMNQNYKLIEQSYVISTLIYGLSSTMIIYTLSLLPQNYNQNYLTKILTLLGAASYSIYLIHLPILSILHRIIIKFHIGVFLHPNLIFLILIFIAIIIGIITHIFIEKPLIVFFKNKFLHTGGN